MPLEVQGHTVPHLKALRYGKDGPKGLSWITTLMPVWGSWKMGIYYINGALSKLNCYALVNNLAKNKYFWVVSSHFIWKGFSNPILYPLILIQNSPSGSHRCILHLLLRKEKRAETLHECQSIHHYFFLVNDLLYRESKSVKTDYRTCSNRTPLLIRKSRGTC